ncbi:MAG TPA: hypothetical protein P5108_12235 [Marmoricola sp.]|mgnify:CR=1 FL=1|nr:hypothetical protein [Nocardioidaceae bacterium]HRV70209.1 hypothetical protein [Marmoricola sp.]
MKSSQPGRILLLALLGALVATFCDAIHVHTKTLSYPNPFWFGQAWWVFPLFFVAFALLAVTYHVLVAAPWLKLPREYSASSGEVMPFIEALVVFVLVYVLSGFGNHDPIFLGIFFLVTFVLRWLAAPDRGFLLLVAVLLAVAGILTEGTLHQFGLVAYREPEIYGVPWWLGGVYLHGAFLLREGMRFLVFSGSSDFSGVGIWDGERRRGGL